MAKTLSFTDTSAQTVKIGDTTTSFTLICGDDNGATDLTNATSITVKLGNDSGYLKSATVDPASLTDPTTGQVTVTFNADLMTSLTAGSYAIEVWVVDSTGTSIYPSDGSTGFTITNNIQSANGATITTITFDDFVNKFNSLTANVMSKTIDTTNFQKRKITGDDGHAILQVNFGDDFYKKVLSLGLGFYTFECTDSAMNKPFDSAWTRGLIFIDSLDSNNVPNAVMIHATDTNGTFYSCDYHNGWTINKQIKSTSGTLNLTSAFSGTLNYVLTGNLLHVSGYVSPSANLAAGTATVLFNLPSSIGTIAESVAVVQQSSGWNLYCLAWSPNGAVSVLKHNTAGTATAITTSTQLQVCADILLK
ncbi:hypothetical protein [Lactiplantibacillus plantarum]|uniref:hypothetical protein n=1 Tax=Lactiplantibacillus plantarum TaxID=1590 RepID=UPI001E57A778|nr:hypothetical protein [Lactiplantibacillus plantarum]